MNVNIDQMDHVFDTIDGFESISNKDFKSPNSVYAQTVLKLNGCDLASISGQEGFGSAVKAGAKKVYEMIKALIKAIRDFLFGSKKEVKDNIKTIGDNTKQLDQLATKLIVEDKGVYETKVSELKFKGEQLFKIASTLGGWGTVLKGKQRDINKDLETETLNASKILHVNPIHFGQITTVGELCCDISSIVENIEDKLSGEFDTNLFELVKKEIKKVVLLADRLTNSGDKLLEECNLFLEKCNEDAKGRTISDDSWKRTWAERAEILSAINLCKIVIKPLKPAVEENRKLIANLKNQTGEWKKYLES